MPPHPPYHKKIKIAPNLENAKFFFFTHRISHIDHHSSVFHFPSHPPLLFSFLLSQYSCHDKCQTQSVRRLFFFFLVTKSLPSQMCAGTRLLRKHHIGASASDISVKVTEMFEGVVTSSQVPAVCEHLREMAASHPFCLHPPYCCF